MDSRLRRRSTAVLVIGIAVGIALPMAGFELYWSSHPPNVPGPPVTLNATVSAGPQVAEHLASPFYGVVFNAANRSTATLTVLGSYFNTTPITWFRFGGGGEAYDPTTGTLYVPPAGGGTYVPEHERVWNLTWFKSWCNSRTPHCAWLGYLPGQINSTQAALHTAAWFHSVLGFVPTEWQLSNEPELWSHFGKNYSLWTTNDSSAPTGAGYATMVYNYISTVHAAYPADRFVGIEAACATCDHSLVPATAAMNGPNLTAMAYHSYPTATGSTTNLAQYYGMLLGPQGIPSTLAGFQGLYMHECPQCGSVPTQIGEFNAGPPGNTSPFTNGYSGAVFLAASVIQALESNVSTFTVFNFDSLYNATSRVPTPEGYLYQRILSNMTMGEDLSITLNGSGTNGVFAVLIHNQSRESFFLVNSNLNVGLRLTVPLAGFPVGGVGSEWSWSPSNETPLAQLGVPLPQTYYVPPQGMLLLSNF